MGAQHWAEQGRIELRAAGIRPAESVGALQDMLSPQELQITLLAADGLSNKEIGERLYMSHRTVAHTCTGSSPSSASPPARNWPPG